MALHFGADAVYLAGAQFGMRAGAENFTPDGIRAAVQLAHVQGAAVHVTCNTLPRDDEMAQLPAYLELLDDAGVDAIIAADLGVITLAKRYAPHVALHVSTQFGVVNSAAAAALYDLGAQRVVLARELSLAEIAAIRAHTPPELELEAFVHGAMCVSFSGRCLLSNYLTGRDANRGRCAQPCRWKYGLTESKRPGQVFDITEDARGTYIFNSRDMCMIDHLPELLAAGITSLKIEGRTKSAYYVGAVTNAYRHAPDGRAVLTQRNKFSVGDTLELVTNAAPPVTFTAQDLRDADGLPLESVPHPMQRFTMPLPCRAAPLSLVRRKLPAETVDIRLECGKI